MPKNWCAFQGLELINAHELASVEMQVVSAWWDLGSKIWVLRHVLQVRASQSTDH